MRFVMIGPKRFNRSWADRSEFILAFLGKITIFGLNAILGAFFASQFVHLSGLISELLIESRDSESLFSNGNWQLLTCCSD